MGRVFDRIERFLEAQRRYPERYVLLCGSLPERVKGEQVILS